MLKISKYLLITSFLLINFSCSNTDIGNVCKCEIENISDENVTHFYNIEDALSCSKKSGRPILVIFTAWASMWDSNASWEIYEDENIRDIITSEFVELALYVDETTKLEEDYMSYYLNRSRCINTVGKKNRAFQVREFNSNIQPFYGIIDFNMNHLTESIGYVPLERKEEFELFLQKGLENHK